MSEFDGSDSGVRGPVPEARNLRGRTAAYGGGGLAWAMHRSVQEVLDMRKGIRLAAVVVALAPAAALADYPSLYNRPDLQAPMGISAAVGGGFIQFMDAGANAAAPGGGSWTARLQLGTRVHVGWEVAYLGSAQAIEALGVDDRAFLLSHGLEGALRLNALTGDWQPYFSAGLGWRRYSIQNTLRNTSSLSSADDTTELPLGVGLAYRYRGLVADLRCELRPVLQGNLLPGINTNTWGVGARLGFEF